MSDDLSEPKRRREARTLTIMVQMYCRAHHEGDGPCDACRALTTYALDRLERCPQNPDKPPCSKCRVHCYRPDLRERIRQVMRWAGPRMLLRHPILALRHLWDEWRHSPRGPR